jgi:hypothetical protein
MLYTIVAAMSKPSGAQKSRLGFCKHLKCSELVPNKGIIPEPCLALAMASKNAFQVPETDAKYSSEIE